MSEPSIEQIAETLAKRTDAFECYRLARRDVRVSFEAGQLRSAETVERSGVGLRVVVNGRLAVGGTGDPAALARTIELTIEAADFGDACEFAFAPSASGSEVAVFDADVAATGPDTLVTAGREALDALGDLANDNVTLSADAWASWDRCDFINSSGQRFDYEATSRGLSASIERFDEDDIFRLGESDECCDGRFDAADLIGRLRTRYRQALRVVAAGPGRQPILFTPRGLNGLLVPLLTGLDGRNVADGISPLADKLDAGPLLDAKLTVIDDGSASGRPGSQPFDDEGVPSERTVLVEGGCVRRFLLDLRSAGELGLASTAKASRDLAAPPAPAQSNLLVQPDPAGPSADAMVADLPDGLIVDHLIGVGQGNVLAGDYANTVGLGYAVRGGEIAGRVKDLSIAGNLYEDLREVVAIENRAHWRGETCLPHLRADSIHIATGG